MQGILVYIYNIALLILLMQSMEVCLYAWKKTRASWLRDLKWLCLLLLGECVVTFAFDMGLVQSDLRGLDWLYLGVRVATEAGICLILLQLSAHASGSRCPRWFYALVLGCLGLALAAMFLPVSRILSSATLSILYFPMFVVMIHLWRLSFMAEKMRLVRYRRFFLVSAIAFAGFFCWQIVVFFLNEGGWVDLRYRINGPVDCCWLLLCAAIRRLAGEETRRADSRMIAEALRKEIGDERTATKWEDEAVTAERFCKHYSLTGRESEITELILKGKGNQEIAETLFISIGTVKHHVHNIFKKLDIERRSQLMRAFIDFRGEE